MLLNFLQFSRQFCEVGSINNLSPRWIDCAPAVKLRACWLPKYSNLRSWDSQEPKLANWLKKKRKSRVGKKVKDKREKFCPVPTNSATHNKTLCVYLVWSTFFLVPFTQFYWGNPLPFQSYDIVNLRHRPSPLCEVLSLQKILRQLLLLLRKCIW